MQSYGAGRREIYRGRAYRKKIYEAVKPTIDTGLHGKLKDFLGIDYKMPKPRKTTRRRYGRKRRSFKRRITRAVQPYSIVRTFKTSISFSHDPGAAGAIAVAQLKLNSAYDPSGNITATQQPLGFDQYTALYQRCAVIGWKVRLQCVSTDNTNPMVIGFTPLVSSTNLTSYDHYRELPGTVSTVVTPDVDKNFITAKGSVKHFFLPKSARMLSDDTITHGVGGDPSRLLYGHIFAQSLDKTTDVGTVRYVCDIYQTVVFYVPEIPARSTI